jgi:Tol biopolymer transport system component
MSIRYLEIKKNYNQIIRRYLFVKVCGLRLSLIFLVPLSLTSLITKGQGLPIKATRTISFETNEGTDMDVDLSPDGSTIVFDLLGDLYTLPANGGVARQLTRGLAMNRHPVWSPSGKQIAFISDASGENHVNVIDSNGSNQRVLKSSYPPTG